MDSNKILNKKTLTYRRIYFIYHAVKETCKEYGTSRHVYLHPYITCIYEYIYIIFSIFLYIITVYSVFHTEDILQRDLVGQTYQENASYLTLYAIKSIIE